MSQYVGLDVSVKEVSICVVNTEGAVLARGTVQTDPDQIAVFVEQHAPDALRVVHESGSMAIWLTRDLSKRGVPIICIDARLTHKALSGRINKTDRGDPPQAAPPDRRPALARLPRPASGSRAFAAG